jgi:hypothetical protein
MCDNASSTKGSLPRRCAPSMGGKGGITSPYRPERLGNLLCRTKVLEFRHRLVHHCTPGLQCPPLEPLLKKLGLNMETDPWNPLWNKVCNSSKRTSQLVDAYAHTN